MSNTSALNIANLQVFAEAVAATDRSNGTYESNLASDPHYYIWQSNFQTIPMGMNGEPEQFVQRMIDAIPCVNAIRIPFNINSFNADGSLDPMFERFLLAAANHGLQLILVLADGDAQEFEGTSAEIVTALNGTIFDNVSHGWQMMKTWMDSHPSVDAAVYGWELLNEPATYRRAVENADPAARELVEKELVSLYVSHMAQLAEIVTANSDAKVLVSAWGYGGDTATLADVNVDGISAINALRTAVGDDLVWSVHFYPGWMGSAQITDPAELRDVWSRLMAPLGGDDIIMTEVNTPGGSTYNPFQPSQVSTETALSLDWLKGMGVGIGWFPALQTGASSLAVIERDGDIRYLNQSSLASALNAFSTGLQTPQHDGGEFIRAELVEAKLRNQIGDSDYAAGRMDTVNSAGFGFGYDGNDTVIGAAAANNFLYGGAGNDFVAGAARDDFLFGQGGSDFIVSGGGLDYLFGGEGNDTLVGSGYGNTAYGGDGADLFVLTAGAKLTVVDYASGQKDRWMSSADGRYLGHETLDVNQDGDLDLIVEFSDGGQFIFLGAGEAGRLATVLSGLSLHAATVAQKAAELLRLSAQSQTIPDQLSTLFIEELPSGQTAAKRLVGNNLAEYLVGGGGSDIISANGGSDIVFGGAGTDRLDGATGADVLFGGLGDDWLSGGSGSDSVFGGIGNDLIAAGVGNDILSGGDGSDTMKADGGADIVAGDEGDDLIDGGAGHDSLFGGSDADRLTGGAGNDLIDGGAGNDTAVFEGSISAFVSLALEGPQNTGHGLDELVDIENILSGAGNDRLIGNVQNNILSSGAGNDSLSGERGNDSLFGGAGRDTIDGGDNDDLLYGGVDRDHLRGGLGNDILDGGLGSDTLTGGGGYDSFLFSTKPSNDNVDKIADFDAAFDTITLEISVFKALAAGDLVSGAFASNTTGFATDVDDRIIYECDSGKLFYDVDGTGSKPSVLFAQLDPWLNLTASQFDVV